MSRQDEARLGDIVEALDAIRDHLTRGDLHDGLVYDAVRVRLIEIGEAVKGIDPEALAGVPDVPWREITRMRDHLAHRYFDTDHAIVRTSSTTTLAHSKRQRSPCSREPTGTTTRPDRK